MRPQRDDGGALDRAHDDVKVRCGVQPPAEAPSDSSDDATTMTLRDECELDLAFPLDGQRDPAARLAAIAEFMAASGYGEEFYLHGEATALLEDKMAALLGFEAGVWFPGGVMAQGAALRVHAAATGRSAVGLHPTSHLLVHEERGFSEAHGAAAVELGAPDGPVTAEAVRAAPEPLAAVFVELPQRENGGLLPSWEQLEAVKAAAREAGAALHVDGARLWGCRPHFGGRTYAEIVRGCSSVYVSMYKDVGALAGAVLVGDAAFAAEARLWRTRLGGRLVRAWPEICDALRLLDGCVAGIDACVARARELAAAVAALPGLAVEQSPPHTNLFHVLVSAPAGRADDARDAAARETGVWLCRRFKAAAPDAATCRMEITVGSVALAAPLDTIARAFAAFSRALCT